VFLNFAYFFVLYQNNIILAKYLLFVNIILQRRILTLLCFDMKAKLIIEQAVQNALLGHSSIMPHYG